MKRLMKVVLVGLIVFSLEGCIFKEDIEKDYQKHISHVVETGGIQITYPFAYPSSHSSDSMFEFKLNNNDRNSVFTTTTFLGERNNVFYESDSKVYGNVDYESVRSMLEIPEISFDDLMFPIYSDYLSGYSLKEDEKYRVYTKETVYKNEEFNVNLFETASDLLIEESGDLAERYLEEYYFDNILEGESMKVTVTFDINKGYFSSLLLEFDSTELDTLEFLFEDFSEEFIMSDYSFYIDDAAGSYYTPLVPIESVEVNEAINGVAEIRGDKDVYALVVEEDGSYHFNYETTDDVMMNLRVFTDEYNISVDRFNDFDLELEEGEYFFVIYCMNTEEAVPYTIEVTQN